MTGIVLHLLKTESYFKEVIKIVKKENKSSIVYVTANKPYEFLTTLFKKSKIDTDRILFIDCISKRFSSSKDFDAKNCLFLEGPEALTSLSISITESLKSIPGKKTLFLDSMSMFLIYNDPKLLVKFSNFLLAKMRERLVDTIIISLESDSAKDLITQIISISDKVIKGGKNVS